LHLAEDRAQDPAERAILHLLRQDVQRSHNGDAAGHHRGKLPREDDELLDRDPRLADAKERLAGRRLSDIQANLPEMMFSDDREKIGVIRLFIDHFGGLSDFPIDKILHLSGTANILGHPEFVKKENLEAIIELMENKEMLVHLLDKRKLREEQEEELKNSTT